MEEKQVDKLNSQSLDSKNNEIAQKILDAETVEETQDLTALFNLNSQKRNVLRVLKMNNLLDKVTDQIIERFEKNPNLFTNEDLLKYMQVTESAIDRANKNLNMIEDTPSIQLLQQNQVNININDGLNRESRQRVIETVQAILNSSQDSLTDGDNIVEVKPNDREQE